MRNIEIHGNDEGFTNFFLSEHQNWFGLDDNLGPVAISIRREKVPTSALIAGITGGGGVGGGGGGGTGFLGNANGNVAANNNNNGNSMENGSSGSSSLAPSIGEKEQFMYRIMVSRKCRSYRILMILYDIL